MNRWWLAAIGLAIGIAALFALLPRESPPLDDIDPASRAALEKVLRDSRSQP